MMIIAIDGPAGAGKSTIAKIVAKTLSLEYVDSGAIYRSLTKKVLDSGLKIDNYSEIEKLIQTVILTKNEDQILVNGIDYGLTIRQDEVTESVSKIASIKAVRKVTNDFLNRYSQSVNIVMDGRDIGTEVFPNAEFKFYIDASVEERARRRVADLGLSSDEFEKVKQSIAQRDFDDMNREVAPLKRANDAVYLDTTTLSIDEVVNNIIKHIT